MATKKKPAPKKAAKTIKSARSAGSKASKKPAPKSKAASKKTAKKVAKPATKKIAHPSGGAHTKKAVTKPAPKKAAHPVGTASKSVKPAPVKSVHVEKKPAEPKSVVNVRSLIKPVIKPIVKKDPPKPVKVVIPKTSTNKSVKYQPEFTKSVLDSQPHETTGPTMRYSDSELNEFRDLITKKLDAAKKELSYLQGLITRKDESGDMEDGRYMTMEDGSVSMEREQLSQMASRQIQFIDHLEKAMMRIENKTYGICRVTGKLIDKARLRAVPHATLSIEAKQMMNK
jgi:RNA polymerase-binding transcription factor DksA